MDEQLRDPTIGVETPWRHRFYLVGTRPGHDPDRCLGHWTDRHPELVLALPGLLAYRQNRPAPGTRPMLLCAETWFVDAAAEATAFASDAYRQVVAPDEARFTDGRARHATVVSAHAPRHPDSWRRLAVGAGASSPYAETLRLCRPLRPGTAPVVRSTWLTDPDRGSGPGLLCRTRTWTTDAWDAA